MKHLLPILLLISGTLTAQTVRVATSTSTSAPTVYSRAGVDTAKDALRREIAALRAEVTALRSAVIQMTPGAADTLRNINRHLTDMRNRTETVNTSWWRADQTITARIDSGVVAQRIVNTATTAQINGVQSQAATALQGLQTLQTLQLQTKQLTEQQAAQQALLNKVEAWIRSY